MNYITKSKAGIEYLAKRCFRNKTLFDRMTFHVITDKNWGYDARVVNKRRNKDRNDYYHIIINRWSHESLAATLLHEIGHIENNYQRRINGKRRTGEVEAEFQAQLWAIERAKELGWNKIVDQLLSWFERWARNGVHRGHWDTCKRRYILAGRLAIERGVIQTLGTK